MIKISSLLGKRTNANIPRDRGDIIQNMKSESRCIGCSEAGDWVRDTPECILKVHKKDKSSKSNVMNEDLARHEYNYKKYIAEDTKVSAFFVQGRSSAPY